MKPNANMQLAKQKLSRAPLGRVLVDRGDITETALRWVLWEQSLRNAIAAGFLCLSAPISARSRASIWGVSLDSRTGSGAVPGSTSSPPRCAANVGIPAYPRWLRRRRRQRRGVSTRPQTRARRAGNGAGFVASWRAAVPRSGSTSGCWSALASDEAATHPATRAEPWNVLCNEPAELLRAASDHERFNHRTSRKRDRRECKEESG